MREKSDENWNVGAQCLDASSVNAAANRLYYSVFQAILGFAAAKQGYVYEGFGAHRAMARIVRSQGKGRSRYADVFEDLMGLRICADYEPESPDIEEIKALFADSDAIRKYYIREAEK